MTSNPSLPQLEVRNSRHPAPAEPALFQERYIVGVDLGQSNDYTAICVVRRLDAAGKSPIFQVGHLQRVPLGTPYPGVVSTVMDLLCRPEIRGKAEMVIDYTGVGRPVFDMFRVQGVTPIGVSITGGSAITSDGPIWSVPKGHLISQIQALLHQGRLKIHADLPDATTLVNELQSMKLDFTDTGYIKFNARSGAHDDMVLALGVALWRANTDDSFTRWLDYLWMVGNGTVNSGEPALQKAKFVLKNPGGITTLQTITGRTVQMDDGGCVELNEDEARPMIQVGWQVVR